MGGGWYGWWVRGGALWAGLVEDEDLRGLTLTPTLTPTLTLTLTLTLLRTRICEVSESSRSLTRLCTEHTCCSTRGEAASTTCRIRLASASSSSVARKAETSLVGSFWMKPTVSVKSTCPGLGLGSG